MNVYKIEIRFGEANFKVTDNFVYFTHHDIKYFSLTDLDELFFKMYGTSGYASLLHEAKKLKHANIVSSTLPISKETESIWVVGTFTELIGNTKYDWTVHPIDITEL